MNKTLQYYSNGKLLLTAEYVVLDGAKALALPTKLGQSLTITQNPSKHITWKSIDNKNDIWYEGEFSLDTLNSTAPDEFSNRLTQIFKAINLLRPDFFLQFDGLDIKTHLEFDRDWGLGSSSTLINNLANWANIDAYKLLELTFGGSGYDIACAQHDTAIFYAIEHKTPKVDAIEFKPSFKSKLHFIHLNKKQNSRDGIAHYKAQKSNKTDIVKNINALTDQMVSCDSLTEFEKLIDMHETLISDTINLKPIKTKLFSNYKGSIKSLGAWGGDFILATGSKNYCESYFKPKGYHTIISFEDMIK